MPARHYKETVQERLAILPTIIKTDLGLTKLLQ